MKRQFQSLAGLLLLAHTAGCAAPGYYLHTLTGQLEIIGKRRPLEAVLSDPATSPKVRHQLELVQRLREFASRELGLPDNSSYRSYADLERPFVLWNVFAAPEFSLEPRRWCFLFAGCVSYRGYFTRDRAERFAADLNRDGFDVYVGGVPAYSTLGWFNDPVLNTFVHRSEADLAGLLFHELAHQVVYVGGDTAFNESFATVVELAGVQHWFEQQGTRTQAEAYRRKIERRQQFTALVLTHKQRLRQLYVSNVGVDDKRLAKARAFVALRNDYAELKNSWGGFGDYDAWMAQELNNAHLAAIGLYNQHVRALENLLAQEQGDLVAFYRAVRRLAELPKSERAAALERLSAS